MALLRESSPRENSAVVLTVALCLVFVVLYSLVFPRDLGRELFLVPRSVTNLADDKDGKLTPGGTFFQLGDREGYWDAQGRLLRSHAKRPQFVADGERLAWYDAAQDQTVVEGLDGVLFQVKGQKYPFWSHGRLFFMDENRLALTAVGAKGQPLWYKQFAGLVSSVDASENRTAVGTIDGKVQVFDNKGAAPEAFLPGGSRLPVIYNVALSRDEKSLLVLAGVDPKRFLILEKGGGDFRPIFHKPLSENKPWPTWLGFLDTGKLTYHEVDGALAVMDSHDTARENLFPFPGNLQDVHYLAGREIVILEAGADSQQNLLLDSLEGRPFLRVDFQANNVLFQPQGDSLVLGLDQSLLNLELKYQ